MTNSESPIFAEDLEHMNPKLRAESYEDGNSEGSCANSDYGSDCVDSKDPNSRTGRFSDAEQQVLVNLIKNDEELCRSFLHRIRARQYDKKSWMHEISLRFNKLSPTKRSLDAVRHHFMLRRASKDNHTTLVWHAMRCKRRAGCTKCLLLDRYRVQEGLVRCGIARCKVCKSNLPHVFEPFNPHELLPNNPGSPPARGSSNQLDSQENVLSNEQQQTLFLQSLSRSTTSSSDRQQQQLLETTSNMLPTPSSPLPSPTIPSLASLLGSTQDQLHSQLFQHRVQLLGMMLNRRKQEQQAQELQRQQLAARQMAGLHLLGLGQGTDTTTGHRSAPQQLSTLQSLTSPNASNFLYQHPSLDLESIEKKRKLSDLLMQSDLLTQACDPRKKVFTD